MKKKIFLAVINITAFFNVAAAQTLRGTVKSEEGLPIENVSVRIGATSYAVTDAKGVFELPASLPPPLTVTLHHPGYFTGAVRIQRTNAVYYLQKATPPQPLEEVVVSSSRNESKILAPTAKITTETLEQYGPADLTTPINRVPGVFIQSGAINTNRITIRGVGSRTLYGANKIRTYFNGIPVTNGTGETAIDTYNPEDLETIEIVKGPKAPLYGTSLGGTLLLRSGTPAPGSASVSNTLTLGSYHLLKNSVGADYAGNALSLHVNYEHMETAGFRENNAYQRNSVLLTPSYTFNETNKLHLLFQQVHYTAQIPSSLGKTDFTENPARAATTWAAAKGYEDQQQTLAGLSYTHAFTPSFRNSSSVFYTHTDHYEPRPFNILGEATRGFGARTVFTKEIALRNKRGELHLGGEWYKDEYRWRTLENLYEENEGQGSLEGAVLSRNEEFRSRWNLFGNISLAATEKLSLQLGFNINTTRYAFQDEFHTGAENTSASRNFNPIFAPGASLHYALRPEAAVYVSAHRGFNYPTLEETLTPEGIINPEIGPEKGWNYEAGSEFFFLNRKLHLNAAAYLLDIRDLLVAQRTGDDQYIGKNAGRTLHRGLEVAGEYVFEPTSLQIAPFFTASFNFHTFREFTDEDEDYSGNALTGVPDKKLTAGVRITHTNGLSLSANYQRVGAMPMDDSNTLHSDAYNLLHLKAGYRVTLAPYFILEARAGINNLTNKKYASAILINATAFGGGEPRYYYPGMPANYYGSLLLKYTFPDKKRNPGL